MREIKHKSVLPIYGSIASAAIYCLFFPLYKLSHFVLLAAAVCAVYFLLSLIFPGTVETVEEPPELHEKTEAEKLMDEGNRAVDEMEKLKNSIGNAVIGEKIDKLISLTKRIFQDAAEDPADIPQIRHFASYFLPATLKLLYAYDRMSSQEIEGENISSSKQRIEEILDTTATAYQKQLDALFANENLDIDTDITVLEGMLKRSGLTDRDF